MSTVEPTPAGTAPATYWGQGATANPESHVLRGIRTRVVGVVAALVVQATIAVLGVLPALPGVAYSVASYDSYVYQSQPVSFWIQFALIELIAAVVVSVAFGPVVRLGDMPVIGRLVLGLAFVAVPAIGIVLGAIAAVHGAAVYGPAAAGVSYLATGFFATLFFGLPLIALATGVSRRTGAASPS